MSESAALFEREQGRECRIVGRTGGSGPQWDQREGQNEGDGKKPMGRNENIDAQFLSQTSRANPPLGEK